MKLSNIQLALNLVGSQHRYQYFLIFILFLLWIQVNFLLLGQSMIYVNPVFYCDGNKDDIVSQKDACTIIDRCQIIDYFTLTSDMNLYCQDQQKRSVIQSIFTIGAFSGLVGINILSDLKGRKTSALISLIFMNLGNLGIVLGGHFQIFGLLIVSQILCGLGTFSIVTLSYVVLSDFCNRQFKPKAIVMVNTAWGLSTIILGIFYLVKLHWFTFMLYIVMFPSLVISTVFFLFLIQSPNILVNQNKKQQCFEVLRKLAHFNKKPFFKKQIRELLDETQDQIQGNSSNQENQVEHKKLKQAINLKKIIKIIRETQNLKHLIILTIILGTANINYYGIAYAFQLEGMGFGINSIIAGSVELASFLYLNFFIAITPRRVGIAGFYGVCAILGLLFLIPGIKHVQMLSTVLLGISRVFSTIGYTMIICIHIEAFSTKIQSTAAGMIQAFGLYGAFLAPLIVDLAQNIQIDPVALISIMLNLAIWPNIFLKQTFIKKKKSQQLQSLIQNSQSTQQQNKHSCEDLKDSLLTLGDEQNYRNQQVQKEIQYEKNQKSDKFTEETSLQQ